MMTVYLSKHSRMMTMYLSKYSSMMIMYLSKYSSVNQEMQTDSMRASFGLSTAFPCKS